MGYRDAFRSFWVVIFLLCALVSASAVPSDVFVVLDVSGSMRTGGVASEVKAYIGKEVVGALLKAGDRFTLIAFGSDARQLFSRTVETEADKASISKEIDAIKTDDAYTDLGVALEKLDAALSSGKDGSRKTIAVFITDGKNAPPPASPYSGKDLAVDERFKDVGRRIAMKGWNLYVIGVGEKTDAPAVAAAVEGSKLAEAKDALKTEKLSSYVQDVSKAAEERAASAAKEKAAGGKAAGSGVGNGSSESGSAAFPWVVIIIVIAIAALGAVLFLVLRARKPKDEDAASSQKKV